MVSRCRNWCREDHQGCVVQVVQLRLRQRSETPTSVPASTAILDLHQMTCSKITIYSQDMFRQKVLFETQGILLHRATKPGIMCNSSTISIIVQLILILSKLFSSLSLCVCIVKHCCRHTENLDVVTDYLTAVSPDLIVSIVSGEAGFGGQAAHHLAHQQQGAPGANIDLGAVYQNTVENRVTRTFSQHWIIVGKHLRFGFTI